MAKLRVLVTRAHGWRCWLCQRPISPTLPGTDPMGLSLDHVLPRSRGGSDDVANLRPAHLSCNQGRRNRLASTVRRGHLRVTESNADWFAVDDDPRFLDGAERGSTPTPLPPAQARKNGEIPTDTDESHT